MRRCAFLVTLLCLLPALVWPDVQQLPLLWNYTARQGQTFVHILTWCAGTVAQCQGAAPPLVNLTGYTAKLQLRDTVSSTVIDEFTETTGIALGGAAGTITWTMTATETAALPVGSLSYDLRLTSGTSIVTYLVYGHLNVHKRITQ